MRVVGRARHVLAKVDVVTAKNGKGKHSPSQHPSCEAGLISCINYPRSQAERNAANIQLSDRPYNQRLIANCNRRSQKYPDGVASRPTFFLPLGETSLQKLMSDGALHACQIDEEIVHSSDPNRFFVGIVTNRAEGLISSKPPSMRWRRTRVNYLKPKEKRSSNCSTKGISAILLPS